jgi:uncharacterized RDD family membrane protein YckC
MQLDCPHCGQALDYSGRRPSFCAYCGKAIERPTLESTAAFDDEAATLPPEPRTTTTELELETVGGYRLLRPLGAGGMGTVYEAEDSATGRHVALKLLAAEYAGSPDSLERFRREGRLASAIAHPRCVFVLAADEEAGRPYIVMELMPGNTLKELVEQQGHLAPAEAVAKILDVIDGLREAHRLGVVHRDVKPSNCFLEASGRVKVGDFGLSKSLLLEAHLTQTGAFVGTPLFASPEQVRGESVDHQSDVYSVAATLYCLLTGRAPFQSKDAAITLVRIASDPPPPMRTLRPELPEALDTVVLRGLERDRQRRWRNLDQFRTALLPFLPGQQPAAGLGVRFSAFLVDYHLLMAAGWCGGMALILATGHDLMDPQSAVKLTPWQLGLSVLLWTLCFGLPEAIWCGSLGKWLLDLRVRKAGGGRPGPGRIALRTLLFYVLASLGTLGTLPFLAGWEGLKADEQVMRSMFFVAFYPLEALGIALLVSTMRTRNGYRGLHEFLSGTCIVRLPAAEKRWLGRTGRVDQPLARPAGLPERLGAYAVLGALRWESEAKVLLGEDAALERRVVIWLRAAADPPLMPARREVARPTRLRWLAGGQDDAQRWDAFLAPAGRSLTELVAAEGCLPWSEVRQILAHLAEELTQAAKDGTLPACLRVDQVWAQPGGHIQLLDWPLNNVEASDMPPPAQPTLALLAQVAVLALQGQAWRGGDAQVLRRSVRPPLPEHAAALLARLLALKRPYQNVQEFEAELAATRDRPAEVTRGRRAAHLAALTGLFFFPLFSCLVPAGWVPGYFAALILAVRVELSKQALQELEQGAWREFAVSSVSPDPLVRLHGLAQLQADLELRDQLLQQIARDQRERQARQEMSWLLRTYGRQLDKEAQRQTQQQERFGSLPRIGNRVNGFRPWASACASSDANPVKVMMLIFGASFSVLLLFWPLVWVLWAGLWRGGFSFRWLDLALARSDGSKAARWQCALRALLVWAPLAVFWTAALWLGVWYWSAWPADKPGVWALWLSSGLWWAGLILLPVYALLAVLFPRRSLHDWLAGTYLVPR